MEKKILKVIIIIAMIIVLLAASVFSIIGGIVEVVKEFFRNLVGLVVDAAETMWKIVEAAWDAIRQFLGVSVVENGMYIYPVERDQVTALKEQIDSKGIDTDNSGITEVMLKKILLAQAVTASTRDTLCVSEVTEEEILNDTGYKDLTTYFNEACTRKNSSVEWPIDDHNYNLYYITDNFFYFRDADNMIKKGSDKYYLGIMGSIDVETEEETEEGKTLKTLNYVPQDEFEAIMKRYLEKVDDNKAGSQEEYDLLHNYTIDDNGQMIVYKIVENKNSYKYIFTNNNSNTRIEENKDEDNSSYVVERVPLNMQDSVDTSTYSLSVELLMHFLDISGSPQYLDEFIDYALEKSKITITGYALENEQVSYEKNTYNVAHPFIFELYDMVNGVDAGADNMQIYRPLIYDRIYEESGFDCSIVDLPNFEDIDYGEITEDASTEGYDDGSTESEANSTEENDDGSTQYVDDTSTEDTEGDADEEEKENTPTVGKISEYLLSAYDPAGFSLGDAIGEEITINKKYETSWAFCISSVSTWFGNITYGAPIRNKEYSIDAVECNRQEYNDFNEGSLQFYKNVNDEEKTNIYIDNERAKEAGINGDGSTTIVDSQDIFDDILSEDIRPRKKNQFQKLAGTRIRINFYGRWW